MISAQLSAKQCAREGCRKWIYAAEMHLTPTAFARRVSVLSPVAEADGGVAAPRVEPRIDRGGDETQSEIDQEREYRIALAAFKLKELRAKVAGKGLRQREKRGR